MDGGNRGISPVVGVVLFVAVVAALGAVSMAFIFDAGDGQDDKPAPNTQMNMDQVKMVQLYNNPDVVEYELKMIGGEKLDGSKVEIQGVKNPRQLNGKQFSAGESITVTPVEDQVRIVYRSEDRVDAVLHTFNVTPGGSVAMWDCDQLAKDNGHPSPGPMPWTFNVTVPQGKIVNCDIMTEGYIDVEKNAELIGYAKSVDNENKYVNLAPGSVVHGDVTATAEITGEDATVLSDVVGTDGSSEEPDIKFNGSSRVEGDLRIESEPGNPGSQIFLNDTTAINGDVSASKGATGDLTLQDGNVSIDGDIDFSEAGSTSLDLNPPGPGTGREYNISGDIVLEPGDGTLDAQIKYMKLDGDIVIYNTEPTNRLTLEETIIQGDLYTDLSSSQITYKSNVNIQGNERGVDQYDGFENLYANFTSATVPAQDNDVITITFDTELTGITQGQVRSAFTIKNLKGTNRIRNTGHSVSGKTVTIQLTSAVDATNPNIRIESDDIRSALEAGGLPFEQLDEPVQNNAGD
ncbi:type IV pilin [Halovenus marina]|uniref:type IV pilin n=1 Tax=Halovenus marina TaxID=3396621 RepID=UPI003F56A46C